MRKYAGMMIAAALAFGGMLVARPAAPVESQAPSAESGFAAVPGQKGGWDLTGPYEVVPNWPKPLSQLPGPRRLDLWRDGGRLCRKRRSRVLRPAGRVAAADAAAGHRPAARTEVPPAAGGAAGAARRQAACLAVASAKAGPSRGNAPLLGAARTFRVRVASYGCLQTKFAASSILPAPLYRAT
jgi:hypothetical protein